MDIGKHEYESPYHLNNFQKYSVGLLDFIHEMLYPDTRTASNRNALHRWASECAIHLRRVNEWGNEQYSAPHVILNMSFVILVLRFELTATSSPPSFGGSSSHSNIIIAIRSHQKSQNHLMYHLSFDRTMKATSTAPTQLLRWDGWRRWWWQRQGS